jgi:hypothetical protein
VERKSGRIRRVNYREATLAIFVALSASLALAEDFKLINGKEYKNATVSRVEPDGIVLKSKSGITKVYFTELPKDVQERFHYDAEKAVEFQRQRSEAIRQHDDRQKAAKQPETTSDRISAVAERLRALTEPKVPMRGDVHAEIDYSSPQKLAADAHTRAQGLALSPEEEKERLTQIPAGGICVIKLWATTDGGADPKRLSYVLFDDGGKVIGRSAGQWRAMPSGGYPRWMALDQVDLPAFGRLRIYDTLEAKTLAEYVIRPNQEPERTCCDE